MWFRQMAGVLSAVGIGLSPYLAHAQDVQIWLDKGAIDLELQDGKVVTLEAGEYLTCTGALCEILPLGAAPVRPEFAQALGQGAAASAPAAGGLAPGALGLSAGTLAAAGIAGGVVVVAGAIIAVAAAAESSTSTTSTSN
ncbi:MAG: hypothetical protein AAF479_10715 [Pseudomonadota bacterium]